LKVYSITIKIKND